MLYKDTHNNLAYVAKPYRFHTKTRDFKLILMSYEKLNLTLVFYIIEFIRLAANAQLSHASYPPSRFNKFNNT